MCHSVRMITAGIAIAASFSAAAVTSTFSTDSEGWTAAGDVASPVTWLATGGNPGGHISIIDAVTGGTTYFVAPAAYLGDKSTAIGSNLTFDLQQVYPGAANQFDNADVILQGGGLTIVFDTVNNPGNGSWTSYTVPLVASGWYLNALGGTSVTTPQFSAVMGALTSLQIRAEYQTGADTGKLDNVSLVPEPGLVELFLFGSMMTLGAARWQRRGAA